ncbi:MAG: hypothetical protein ABSG64_00230 [Solirubrobacteraceae bacterium]|jgi:hypothetical protein
MPTADETEYPITKEFVVTNEPVEVVFHSNTHYGSHDANRSLDLPVEILAGGDARACPSLGREWSEILHGVEGRAETSERRAGGGGGYVDRDVTIRVALEACPVVIHALVRHAYESDDYNHSDRSHYAVRVVSGATRASPPSCGAP